MTLSRQWKKFQRLPDAVLLDLDNTLYSYDPAHKAAMEAVQEKAVKAFSIAPENFVQAFEQARNGIGERLNGTAAGHSRLLYFQNMLEIMGLGSQVLLALDFEQAYWRTFLSHAVLFDGARDFLDDLRLLGIPAAIVTDLTAQIQFRKIVYFGLDRAIDYIVTSEEAGADKPFMMPFELAVKKVRPKGDVVWMIGDSAERDVAGARVAVGAMTIQKLHAGVIKGEGDLAPDAAFEHFRELRDLLGKLNPGIKKDAE